jgi:hypothetical protein
MHLKKRLEPKASTNAPTRARKKQQVIVLDGPTTAPVLLEQTLSTTTTSTATIDYSTALSLMENAASFTSKELWINDIFWSETLAITVDNSDSSSGMETMNDLGVSQRSRHELVAQSVHASWRVENYWKILWYGLVAHHCRVVEVILRHFHQSRYRSSPMWFFCGEDV